MAQPAEVLGENLFPAFSWLLAVLGCGHITPDSASLVTLPSHLCVDYLLAPFIRTAEIVCRTQVNNAVQGKLLKVLNLIVSFAI